MIRNALLVTEVGSCTARAMWNPWPLRSPTGGARRAWKGGGSRLHTGKASTQGLSSLPPYQRTVWALWCSRHPSREKPAGAGLPGGGAGIPPPRGLSPPCGFRASRPGAAQPLPHSPVRTSNSSKRKESGRQSGHHPSRPGVRYQVLRSDVVAGDAAPAPHNLAHAEPRVDLRAECQVGRQLQGRGKRAGQGQRRIRACHPSAPRLLPHTSSA